MLLFSFIQVGKNGWMFAVVGAVGMCITGCIMELWETAFAGCGKAPAFPCTVNAFSIGEMVCYAHFVSVQNYSLLSVSSPSSSSINAGASSMMEVRRL